MGVCLKSNWREEKDAMSAELASVRNATEILLTVAAVTRKCRSWLQSYEPRPQHPDPTIDLR
jgi:hypothetical protein